MSAERETSSTSSQGQGQTGTPQGEITYSKMPSLMWFIIPFAALLAYGYFGM